MLRPFWELPETLGITVDFRKGMKLLIFYEINFIEHNLPALTFTYVKVKFHEF